MIKIKLWEDTNIQTYEQVENAYSWCVKTFGPPSGERWYYGKDCEDFLGTRFINSPMEIDNFTFVNEDDALLFKLSW